VLLLLTLPCEDLRACNVRDVKGKVFRRVRTYVYGDDAQVVNFKAVTWDLLDFCVR